MKFVDDDDGDDRPVTKTDSDAPQFSFKVNLQYPGALP